MISGPGMKMSGFMILWRIFMQRAALKNKRIALILSMIDMGSVIIDVGCDHGYLPIAAVSAGISKKAFASDMKAGPLARAEANIKNAGLSDRIECRLCDGVSGFSKEDADTIVIAGMGGETIAGIIERALWLKNGRYTLILQPMTMTEELRIFLKETGFETMEERLVADGGKLYNVIKARWVKDTKERMSSGIETILPKCLMNDPLFGEYAKKQKARLIKKRSGLKASSESAKHREEIDGLSKIIEDIKAREEEWQKTQR